MTAINKTEADAIRERLPNVHIVRTMKQKSKRHRYYCVESRPVMRLLDELRGVAKNGGYHGHTKKSKRNRP